MSPVLYQTARCLAGRSCGRSPSSNPRCCTRRRVSPRRRSPCWPRGRRLQHCSRLISADAARRRCWRGGCGDRQARPSARFFFMGICALSPRCPCRRGRGRWATPPGAGVLGIFPSGDGSPSAAWDAALRAVGAARAGMTHLDQARERQGLPPLPFGAALHLGEMLWGNIGTADRLDFTAIGPAVNLVSRLEGLCRPLGRSVLISGTVAAETNAKLIPLGEHDLRGIATPCAVFTLPED